MTIIETQKEGIDSQLQKKGWKIVAKCDRSVLYYNQNKSENNVYITVSTSTPVHQVGNLIKKFKLMSWMLSLAKKPNCSCALKKGKFLNASFNKQNFFLTFSSHQNCDLMWPGITDVIFDIF